MHEEDLGLISGNGRCDATTSVAAPRFRRQAASDPGWRAVFFGGALLRRRVAASPFFYDRRLNAHDGPSFTITVVPGDAYYCVALL